MVNLQDYYNSLPKMTSPKSDFVRHVMNECDVSFNTVMNWVRNKTKPKSTEQLDRLERITGIPKERLFK